MTNDNINPNIDNVIESVEYRHSRQREQAADGGALTAWQRFKHFFGSKRTRFAIGVLLLFTGVYLLLSLMSYFHGAGLADQSRVDNHSIIENAQHQMSNAGAAVGAGVSNWLGGGLGIASFLVVVWCLVIGWRIVRLKPVKFFSTTAHCLFSTVVFALLLGLVDYLIGDLRPAPGGSVGRTCSALLLGMFELYGFLAVNFIALVLWIAVYKDTMGKGISSLSGKVGSLRRPKNDGTTTGPNLTDNINPNVDNAIESDDYRVLRQEELNIDNSKLTFWQKCRQRLCPNLGPKVSALIWLIVGGYLFITLCSYFGGAGLTDQNNVINHSLLDNARHIGRLSNWGGAAGAAVSDFLAGGLGLGSFLVALMCFVWAGRLWWSRKPQYFKTVVCSVCVALLASIVCGNVDLFLGRNFLTWGGSLGRECNNWLNGMFGPFGRWAVGVIAVALMFFFVREMARKSPQPHVSRDTDEPVNNVLQPDFPGDTQDEQPDESDIIAQPEEHHLEDNPMAAQPAAAAQFNRVRRPAKRRPDSTDDSDTQPAEGAVMSDIETAAVSNPHDPTGEYRHYRFPTLDLLQNITMRNDSVDIAEQEANKRRITETLNNYGIGIKEIQVHVGPTVTLFEIIPVEGIRVSKIRNLEDDIALSLKALGVRIIAPMPGRGTIGIEVPNQEPQVVPMRQVLASKAFQESKAKLPMCLGCTVSNEVFVADLTKMPHLLVAGATGKGKSVGLNAIITSLLYKKGPSELKLVLVDPKRVEFSIYADLEKYFFAKAPGEERAIVTDTSRVVHTLNCLVQEMEDRYAILEEVKVRKVEDYNEKWRTELREIRDADGNKRYHYMPYIVAVVDEFSDMIMTAGKEVETPIVRIAQKARAVGIHMIIATQRPSANVITGLIKGNFPGRIAFAVSQMMDSRIIIDRSGAQNLIGRGDMLFSIDGEITRLQCPFVDTPDIERICDFIKEQEDNDRDINHEQTFMLPEYVATDADGGSGGDGERRGSLTDRDPLFNEAVRWIVQGDVASTSSLQRRYEIGYNRAGRIMDQMEAAGIVGPASGGKPRKVLVTPMDVEQILGG